MSRHLAVVTSRTEYVGRHRAPEPVDADYTPLPPYVRQHLAPTHYADRALPAGPADATGLMPAITDDIPTQPHPGDDAR